MYALSYSYYVDSPVLQVKNLTRGRNLRFLQYVEPRIIMKNLYFLVIEAAADASLALAALRSAWIFAFSLAEMLLATINVIIDPTTSPAINNNICLILISKTILSTGTRNRTLIFRFGGVYSAVELYPCICGLVKRHHRLFDSFFLSSTRRERKRPS